MLLPDFSEFLASIDEDAFETEVETSIGFHVAQIRNPLDRNDLNELVNWTILQSVDAATKISLIYLRAYHQWLSERLP